MSQPRQNSSSTTGTSAAQPRVRTTRNTALRLISAGAELAAKPITGFSKIARWRYPGPKSRSGATQAANTAIPIATLPQGADGHSQYAAGNQQDHRQHNAEAQRVKPAGRQVDNPLRRHQDNENNERGDVGRGGCAMRFA